jgi:hypothetical protein
MLEIDGNDDNEVREEIDSSLTIESDMTRVTLTTSDVARLQVAYKDTDDLFSFDFDIRYYSDFDNPVKQVSGPYIWSPSPTEFDSKPFCKIEEATVVASSGSRNQFLVTYSSLDSGAPNRTLNKAGWALFLPSVILLCIHLFKTLSEKRE